ncbi:MAG: peptide chain release factor 1 [Spirochaetes bacterium]|nr:peptide chain release factor 1 [Spirochaetota bacterium]
MEDKLKKIELRSKEIESELIKPEVISNQEKYRTFTRELSQIKPIVQKYTELIKSKEEISSARELLKDEKDADMKDLLKNEVADLTQRIEKLEQDLMVMIIPKDPNSGKNVIMEIRAGTGGEEASLFARDLYRMYSRYIDAQGWGIEVLSASTSGADGFKEVIFSVAGADSYDNLKYESGVHRVQRVPVTEASGRIHTSAVTVAVLSEAEESDIKITPDELRIDVYRSSGHGGQSVNTTDSAVRITHIPTGMVVTCQDEKSQHKNKAKALKVLRARLFEKAERERMEKETEKRRSQVGSGDRSEKIRTYNFPQSRVTDHRIGLTLHTLESVLSGELDEIVSALKKYEQDEALKSESK